MHIVQINLQRNLGGGEVYAHFLCKTLTQLGIKSTLLKGDDAACWELLDMGGTSVVSISDFNPELYNVDETIFISHGPMNDELKRLLVSKFSCWAIAHMPMYGRNPRVYDGYDQVFGVSQYVVDGLKNAGVANVYDEPLYGIADLDRLDRSDTSAFIQNSYFDWDRRKGRDVLFSYLEPFWRFFQSEVPYTKVIKGISLGVVSRITPIKQFPILFKSIVPVLQKYPHVTLDIFGAGGYASVRDLKKVLSPIRSQVRFWGEQRNVAQVYSVIDVLLVGLPEKEAFGLNVLEAQACKVPVLAVNAPPFVETVKNRVNGWLYTDPRQDNGADFERALNEVLRKEYKHWNVCLDDKFTFDRYVERIDKMLRSVAPIEG
ncbi:glycosyltransferase family 4 protein [Leeia sp. TBRC 13508]|uniref:Glycosyltransferase family 4 protein n=1 Tax=Leeia speluncae TaxID=2884804 RepID=A0ABS8D5B2_9NEIS|nr:glycosyltransferase family 4 protein [Leeia speluncae]MCB6183379.1 glycosyltransferase family 4 protein [Leeia speluncae]